MYVDLGKRRRTEMSDKRKRRDDEPETIDRDESKGAEHGEDSLQKNPTKPPRRRLSERGIGSEHARRPPTPDSSPTSKTRF
jgi:hypothetical protein